MQELDKDEVKRMVVPDDGASARIKARVEMFMRRSGAGAELEERLTRLFLDTYADGFSDAVVHTCALDDLEVAQTERPSSEISGRASFANGNTFEKVTGDDHWRCEECWTLMTTTEDMNAHECKPRAQVIQIRGRRR